MDGWFTKRVCDVVFGFDATPKVAGVTKDESGMHLHSHISLDPNAGNFTRRTKTPP